MVLDAVADKTVPIVPDVTGQPAAGSRVEEVSVEPRLARLLGPARTLARLVQIKTDPVSVEGRDAPFSIATTLSSQAPGVRVREGQLVTVRVRIRAVPEPTPSPTVHPRRK